MASILKRFKKVKWGKSFLFGRWGDGTLAWNNVEINSAPIGCPAEAARMDQAIGRDPE
jgi:hypothetical protein